MEKVYEIIYNKSINFKILENKDIEKIIDEIIINKNLNNYVNNIEFNLERSNNLASYSTTLNNNKIAIYPNSINRMLNEINTKNILLNYLEEYFYKNFLILQIILHELEHVYQEKILFKENNLEAFLIRITHMINEQLKNNLYEFLPTERFAEIKSFNETINYEKYCNNYKNIFKLLKINKIQRELMGYHYINKSLYCSLYTFLKKINKSYLIKNIETITKNFNNEKMILYGGPIPIDLYISKLKKLISIKNN